VRLFGRIIPDYVAEVDRLVGQIVAAARREGGTVLIVSDHGMHAALGAVDNPRRGMSGHHTDAPDGVILAAGPLIRGAGESDGGGEERPLPAGEEEIPRVGTVFDVAPTVLYLQGVPLSRQLEGRVMERLLLPGLLQEHPPAATDAYPFDRPAGDGKAIATQMDEALKDQLRALGYI
jgi:arylsulfatase A-like enzyme